MVELHNGCICCTLRGDLLRTVSELAAEKRYDYLVIESSGISEPLPVAQTFVMDVEAEAEQEEDHDDHEHKRSKIGKSKKGKSQAVTPATEKYKSLSNFARLDTLCTVVDATAIYDVLDTVEALSTPNNFTGMTVSVLLRERERERFVVPQRSAAVSHPLQFEIRPQTRKTKGPSPGCFLTRLNLRMSSSSQRPRSSSR